MTERVLHCWKGRSEYAEETHGFGSDEWAEAIVDGDGTCMLQAGHEGPHEFTPDSEIGITFVEPPVKGECVKLQP